MATDRALLTRLRVMAAKVETTTGTAEALTTAEGLYNVMDMSANPDIPPTEREGQGSLDDLAPVHGPRKGVWQFKHEVVGLGSAGDPAWLTNFIGSCGFALDTGVWKPSSTDQTTLTLGAYIDGRFKSIAGAMGKVTFDFMAGKPVVGSYEYNGVWQAPSAVALLAPTYPTVIPPRWAGTAMTIGGTAYKIGKMQIVIDNTLTMREHNGNDTGYHACQITRRKITVKVSPEAQALGTKDWYAAHVAGTEAALSAAVGSSANNIITFAAPKMVLLNPPQDEDDGGIYRDALEFVCIRNTAAGDNSFSITAS
jgi:hypothetical protein